MSSVRNGSQLKKAEEKVLLAMKMPRLTAWLPKQASKTKKKKSNVRNTATSTKQQW